jgi:RNA recognition motif-containing protein
VTFPLQSNSSKLSNFSFYPGLPYKVKKKELKSFFKPLKLKSVRIPRNAKGFAYVGFGSEEDRKRAVVKNKSFIDSHQGGEVTIDNLHSTVDKLKSAF